MTMLRLLHVDDDQDIRDVVELSLGLDTVFETQSCGSGTEALSIAADWKPDLILLDVMMPVMDGPATLKLLRDNSETADIPIVFMTARAQNREIESFCALGAAGVISKPFDPMTLAASVRAIARHAGTELDILQKAFVQRIMDDFAELGRHRVALGDRNLVQTTLLEIKKIAHGLAGAGAVFGYHEISEAAAALEGATAPGLGGSRSVNGILHLLDRLISRAGSVPVARNRRSARLSAPGNAH